MGVASDSQSLSIKLVFGLRMEDLAFGDTQAGRPHRWSRQLTIQRQMQGIAN